MGVYEGRGQLARAVKTLMSQWADTRMSWNDARAAQFEDKYLKTLEQDLRNAVAAMDHIAVYLGQVKHDCGD